MAAARSAAYALMRSLDESESESDAAVRSPRRVESSVVGIAGQILTADGMGAASLYEVVRVGDDRLLGEIIALKGDSATIHLFESAVGLQAGERVTCTGAPLSVELGPGLLGQVFDGLQRPLQIADMHLPSASVPGLSSLDRSPRWEFFSGPLRVGELACPGDVFGSIVETPLHTHLAVVPPGERGRVTFVAADGFYSVDDEVLELEKDGVRRKVTLAHRWPVRTPRPIADSLPVVDQLLTGQRAFDILFPMARGGTTTMPGGGGVGKSMVIHSLATRGNFDAFVLAGCGERGTETAETLRDFPCIDFRGDGRERRPVMERSVLIANTADAPMAAREASIFAAVTIGEYIRDQGRDVALVADSLSRWAEAIREVGDRLGEQHGDGGYPVSLGTRLGQFYNRAGRGYVLGDPARVGSLSIVGTLAPAGGDWTEPVSSTALALSQTFWALDIRLSRRKHFPALNWSASFSAAADAVAPSSAALRAELSALLAAEAALDEMVHLVGKDALRPEQQADLFSARMIREDFLQQNLFTQYDGYCPLYKATGMLENVLLYHRQSRAAALGGRWSRSDAAGSAVVRELQTMKFLDPVLGQAHIAHALGAVREMVLQV
eukprot:c13073_g1_i1.p1 GENE.c13073_g1_i1~~c13073_g1_i1.p1  ORF type:complete len:616 (+),score=87.42 c13073_g1_i1:23-1849(+)